MTLPRKSETGSIGAVLVLVVIVAGLLTFGFVSSERASSDVPTCGGKAMGPGDSCFAYRGGGGGTYDELKAAQPGNQRANRVASVISYSLAGVALVGGVLIQRNGRREQAGRRAALQGSSMREAATALAAQDGLGALVDTARDDASFRKGAGKHEHFRFEHGLVADTAEGPMSFPYRDVQIYRRHAPALSTQQELVTSWRFERGADGPTWETDQGNKTPLGRHLEQVLVSACTENRAAAVQRLSAGETLAFGAVQLDRVRMSFTTFSGARETVPWTSVTQVSLERGLMMKVETAGPTHLLPLAEMTNFWLVLELARIAQAAPGRAAENP